MSSRRGRGSNYTARHIMQVPESERPLMEGLGASSPLQALEKPVASGDKIEIKDLKYLGSYNWTETKSPPEILVPGSPRIWKDVVLPYPSFPADTGKISYVDQNNYRMSSLPFGGLLPLFSAVDKIEATSPFNPEQPDTSSTTFDWSSVDFISDRNGLRKLMRWIDIGPGNLQAARDFRIDMQLAGKKTVLFSRWEKRNREVMQGKTYGFGFEKASTREAVGCENSTAYHRIVTYDMNGLKLVVRFEVDACLPPTSKPAVAKKAPVKVDDLADALAGVQVNTSSDLASSKPQVLKITTAGSIVPQSSLIEMTTRSILRVAEFDWKESYPQLVLSQTPNHFLAVHNRGRFDTEVQKRTLGSPEMKRVEALGQNSLQRLWAVLKKIQEIVVEGGERGRLTLVCRDGQLQVYGRDSETSFLPDEIMDRF